MKIRAKKLTALLASMVLVAGAVTACGQKNAAGKTAADADKKGHSGKIKVVSTIFPSYDWVEEVLGDRVDDCELTLLLSNGIDMHSYQPSAADIAKIAESDLFIYVGGESDGWVDDALKARKNPDQKVINLVDSLGDRAKAEEVVEGMEDHDHHDHDHDKDDHDHDKDDHDHDKGDHDHDKDDHDHDKDDHDHDKDDHDHDKDGHDEDRDHHEAELDEHVWLSLRNSQLFVRDIADALSEIDVEHRDVYEKNADEYEMKLKALDDSYKDAIDQSSKRTLLFGDRFPFRYMVDDYGLKYYAAFSGCSAETEASFETVTFLAGQVDKLGLNYVLTIENSNHKIADTIIQNTSKKDQKIAVLDSMQSVTQKQIDGGLSYLSVMENNLNVLKDVLN